MTWARRCMPSSMRAAEAVASWLDNYARPAAVELYEKATEEASG